MKDKQETRRAKR